MATPPITAAAAGQFFLPIMAGIPLHEDVAPAATAGVPELDTDLVWLCVLHGEEILGQRRSSGPRERQRFHRKLKKELEIQGQLLQIYFGSFKQSLLR